MSFAWIILALAVVVVFWLWSIFNRLVRLKNQVKNAWSQIDVQLRRRYDLIPNLVETVKGYMSYERPTLEAVVQARNQASSLLQGVSSHGGVPAEGSLKELLAAEGTIKSSLGQIFALAENYPQLRATENMQRLQEELASTENKVAFARQAYNDSVMSYNIAQQEFPALMVAKSFGHKAADLFVVEETAAKQPINVRF